MEALSELSLKGVISNLQRRLESKVSAPKNSAVTIYPAEKEDLLGPGRVVIREMEDRFNVLRHLTQCLVKTVKS